MEHGALTGVLRGGHLPIVGARIYMYAASTSGYGAASTNLLTSDVYSDSSGGFNVSGKYSCKEGQQVYVVAVAGNPGAGVNNQSALMAALGDCSSINSSMFVMINEVTTVGAVFALAPFMNGAGQIGTSPSNIQGLARAFASANKLVNIGQGSSPGRALPAGASMPSSKLNALANVIAACVNSVGGVSGSASTCGRLFSYSTASGQVAPTDTISALAAIVRNPTLNVTNIFNLLPALSPFSPSISTAPTDWTLSITYSAGGFHAPSSTAVDSKGNIWVTNAGNSTVTILSQAGVPIAGSPLSGNGLSSPSAIAFDISGNAWVANKAAAAVSSFNADGSARTGSPFSVGVGSSAIATDPDGFVWVANGGSSTITKLSGNGATTGSFANQIASPSAIAINTK